MTGSTMSASVAYSPSSRPKRDWRKIGRLVFLYTCSAIVLFWSLAPIYWVFVSSISTRTELYARPYKVWFPAQPTLEHYVELFTAGAQFRDGGYSPTAGLMGAGLRNSLLTSTISAVLITIIATGAGFIFARIKFKGKGCLFYFVMLLMPLPIWVSLIALFFLFSQIGLIDTIHGQVLLFVTFLLPLSVWLMSTFVRDIPSEIEDAALVDGANQWQILFRIIMPLARPGMIAVFLVSFISVWNNFLIPLIFTRTSDSQPLTVVLTLFIGQYEVSWESMASAAVLTMLPPFLMALFFQRYLVRGLSMGSVKYLMIIEADFALQNVDSVLESMTLEEKIGQLFLLAFSKDRVDEAQVLMQHHFVGASYVSNDNVPDAAAAVELTRRLQGFAASTRLRIPLILGVDQEGAWSVLTGESCPGPGNMALGASHDPEAAYRMYRLIGEEMSAVGLNTIYAPAVDCNSNPHNSIIGMRSFGEPPALVAEMGAAAVRGARDGGVLTTVKHFPGHGDTTADSHRDIPHVSRSREELFAIDLYPFAEGIRAGVDMVMTSHIIFGALDPVNPATLSPRILNGLLRDEMGFDGVILSDSMNMQAMKRFYRPADAAIRAFNAGVDLLMLAEEHYNHNASAYLSEQLSLINAVRNAARNGVISKYRLNDAVRRVLLLKQRLQPTRYRPETVGSPEHTAIELDVARQALSFLRGGESFTSITAAEPLVLVNATTRSSYLPVTGTRGIGPNQAVAAFDEFAKHVQTRKPDVMIISAEEILDTGLPAIPEGAKIIAITENYPLPGMDFDQHSQPQVINRLLAQHPDLIVVALRDPYELASFPGVKTYLCAFSFRPCAAQAAVEVLFGEQSAPGKSPVSIPGTGIEAV